MKKSYLMLAAVATILASCAQNEQINSDLKDNTEPSVIGFSSFSEKASKADNGDNTNILNLEYFHSKFAVYATKQSQVDNSVEYVFGGSAATAAGAKEGTVCTYTGNDNPTFYGSNWSYTDPRYWDKQAGYQFVAYAPALASNPLRYSYVAAGSLVGAAGNDFTAADYVLTGKNLQSKASQAAKNKGFNENGQDLDLMTSEIQTQLGTNHADVQLTFRHILSKVNVLIGKTENIDDADVKIDEVTITNLKDKGSYVESSYDNNSTPRVSAWTPAATNANADYILKYEYSDGEPLLPHTAATTKAVKYLYFIESLVIPQEITNASKVTIKYHVTNGGNTEGFTYSMNLNDAFTEFFDRYNYNLIFTIGPSVITFDASAAAWADEEYSTEIPYVSNI